MLETPGMRLKMNSEIFFLQAFLGFNARVICNLVSIGFPLFGMKKYLFCRVLPHINQPKTSGNGISKLFLPLRRHENNEKLKLSSTTRTRAHPLLVTFDVLRLHVVTEKNQFRCAIFRILIYSNPKILQISFLKPFLASVIKFFSSYKKFRRAVFKRRSCNSKNF